MPSAWVMICKSKYQNVLINLGKGKKKEQVTGLNLRGVRRKRRRIRAGFAAGDLYEVPCSEGLMLDSILCCWCLAIINNLEQGALHDHFTVGPENDTAGPE